MIVLTGATGGIGKTVIPELLKLDAVSGLFNKTPPAATADSHAKFFKVDITDRDAVRAFAQEQRDALKKITLIHFATASIDGLAMTYEAESWKKVMDVNVNGNFNLTQALLPMMMRDSWGRIVHIASVVGGAGKAGTIAYSTSKAALLGMSRTLAKEYGRFNITSNVLTLGYFDVGLIYRLSEKDQSAIVDRIPSRRFGKVSNIVNAVSFLMASEYVNGAVLNIDGGL